MFHVGLDIHTKRISICALDEKGQVVHRSQVRTIQDLVRVLTGLPDRFEVCYEASCGYGHFPDLLRPLATRVLVAHPGQLRLIFRSKDKNDRKDAERLAKLLYLGETPTVHVPSLAVRTWRELINCRSQVIAKRTRAKNTVRALLRGAGVAPPGGSTAAQSAAPGGSASRSLRAGGPAAAPGRPWAAPVGAARPTPPSSTGRGASGA